MDLFSICILINILGLNRLISAHNFTIGTPDSDKSMVLSGIIANFLHKYLNYDEIFVSIILAPTKANQNHFHEDLLRNIFDDQRLTEFTHNIVDRIDNPVRDHRNTMNIIFIDDCKSLTNIVSESTIEEYQLNHKFFIVLTADVQNNSLNEIGKMMLQNGLINVHVLYEHDDGLWTIVTFLPYRSDCSSLDLMNIATFTASNYSEPMNASMEQVFPNKLKNFNKCPLTVAASIVNPILFRNKMNDKLTGIDYEIITQISKSLHFAILFKSSPNGHGIIYPNGSVTGNLALVYNGEAKLAIGGYVTTTDRAKYFTLTFPYLQASFGFCYKENSGFIPLTRLTAPFAYSIWLVNIGFICCSTVILLVSKSVVSWRNFIICDRSPILNMWTVVLGNPIHTISNPHIINGLNFRQFARTILILWIILWLVVRNTYQGALYTFLQGNRHYSPFDTIDKIRNSDCKIMVPPPAYNLIANLNFSKDRIILTKATDFMSNLPILHDENINGVALSQDLTQKAFNLQNSPHRRLEFTKDRLFMYSPVFVFRKKSMLSDVFNKVLGALREAGLIEFWINNYVDDRKDNPKDKEPTKLQINSILAAFQICGLLYMVSSVIFVFETISRKCSCLKNVLDYMTN